MSRYNTFLGKTKIKGKWMDILEIEQFKFNAHIGVHAWEKQLLQTLVLDCQFAIDASKAAKTDQLEDTVDYTAITEAIEHHTHGQHFQLIETLAEQLAVLLQQQFNFSWLKLRLAKPGAIPQAKQVAVCIERGDRQ